MSAFLIALRHLRSIWHAGEIRVLLAALILAVAAVSAVGFFSDRIESALSRQGSVLLGGDLLVIADHPLPAEIAAGAQSRGLKTVSLMEFPSMALHQDNSRLAEIKAVDYGYPLRGTLAVSDMAYGISSNTSAIPARGEVWVESRLATALQVSPGDSITLGDSELKVTAILSHEPASGGDMFNIAPRLMMNLADVPATGLIQYGSRVSYRLLVAGDGAAVTAYQDWLTPRLGRGERVENVSSARPEVRRALEKTRQFLGLAAMSSMILAMVAMSLAAMRHAQRHLDTCALMRCFGASQSFILRMFLWQTAAIGVIGGVIGLLAGHAIQELLNQLAGRLFLEKLPPPTWLPALSGFFAGLAVLLGVMLPHLLSLRGVPALRILRRDMLGAQRTAWVAYVPIWLVLMALVFLNARDAGLGVIVLLGLTGILVLSGMVSWGFRGAIAQATRRLGGAFRLGLQNLLRRPVTSLAQVAGFSLGLMAMLLLTLVRSDLLANWQATLPPDAPNRFVINIQPDQLAPMQDFFAQEGQHPPEVFPMVKGRLVAVNGRAMNPEQYEDDRARRLASREFNLSWAADMQSDNRLVAGRWWRPQEHASPLLSLEQGIAETLGISLGDRLTYDIAGREVEVTVQSLRKVEWDSMRANFFAVTPPELLQGYPATFITSFHLASDQEGLLNRLVAEFPNLTIIDIAAILAQVRSIMDRMAYTVQLVFGFTLLTGLAVLYAAITATRDERQNEAALMRVLGASRRQVMTAVLAEFSVIGLMAGVVAAIGASLLAWIISTRVLQLPYDLNVAVILVAIVSGSVLVPLAAWLGLRSVVSRPPRQALQSV